MTLPKLFLLSAVLLAAFVAPAFAEDATSTNLTASGTQFVDLLVKEDFAGAVGKFDTTMRSALPEEKLREVWQTIQTQAGPFKKQLRTRIEKLGTYDIVYVTCQFEKATLDAKVVYDVQRQVAGLFFIPGNAEAGTFPPPPYART